MVTCPIGLCNCGRIPHALYLSNRPKVMHKYHLYVNKLVFVVASETLQKRSAAYGYRPALVSVVLNFMLIRMRAA